VELQKAFKICGVTLIYFSATAAFGCKYLITLSGTPGISFFKNL